MGDDGLLTFDRASEKFWPRAALDDELMHNADLDIEALFTVHVVGRDGAPAWLHTHGLSRIGAKDFDILDPSKDVVQMRGFDLLRAIAFAIVEGNAASGGTYEIQQPGGEVRFVNVADFTRGAALIWTELRAMDDDSHNEQRFILCEPARGFFARWSRRIEPAHFLTREIPDNVLIHFSTAATNLMAERARQTYSVFRGLADELAVMEIPMLVKIGYRTDHAGDTDHREHMWFTVNECHDASIEATLENDPVDLQRFRRGQRGLHPVEALTDWMILSPAGTITPRDLSRMRVLRRHKGEILRALKRT
jgi:uncharacterized protein YegJ (DUF2314 family)